MDSCCIILAKTGKSLWKLRGESLLTWVMRVAKGYEIIITTNDVLGLMEPVKEEHECQAVEFLKLIRDPEKATRIEYVVEAAMQHTTAGKIHILQPTSPFVQSETIDKADQLLDRYPSVQAVAPVPHQLHAWNQRLVERNEVTFTSWDRRMRNPTKQTKPQHWQFGGLVSVTREAMSKFGTFWTPRCYALEVPWWQAVDVDDVDGLELAEAVVARMELA